MFFKLGDFFPKLPKPGTYWVAPNASIIGNVSLGRDTSIWFGAVIRGDVEPIQIEEGSNIQDNTVIHTDPDCPTYIGKNCTIGHKALIHGCIIGDETIVGMGATILSGARIGCNCLIGANSLITQNKEFPDNSFIVGSPARLIRSITEDEKKKMILLAQRYQNNWRRYSSLLEAF